MIEIKLTCTKTNFIYRVEWISNEPLSFALSDWAKETFNLQLHSLSIRNKDSQLYLALDLIDSGSDGEFFYKLFKLEFIENL